MNTVWDDKLIDLLTGCMIDSDEDAPYLVAADRAQELGMPNLETFLRKWVSLYRVGCPSIATGSRVYGVPKPTSYVDWVIYADAPTRMWIVHLADVVCTEYKDKATGNLVPHETRAVEYEIEGGKDRLRCAVRIGPLNLIIAETDVQWKCWRRGTQILIAERPVTREYAVRTFQSVWSERRGNRRLVG